MDLPGFDHAADAADFDVDDPAALHLQGLTRRVLGDDALVQAERGLHLFLETAVVPEIVGRERLLQQEQAESVQHLEAGFILEAVGAVGIGLEQDVREVFPHLLDHLDVPAMLNLELDPPVALADERHDPFQQFGDGIFDSQAHSDLDVRARPPIKLGQRNARLFRLEVPEGELQPSLGHGVAAVSPRFPVKLFRPGEILGKQQRDQEIAQDQPGGRSRLVAIGGSCLGDHFSIPAQAFRMDLDDNELPAFLPAEAGLEEAHVRQVEQR